MLRSVKDLEDYRLGASDGVIGRVIDFYVDEKTWLIRHMTASTGAWGFGRNAIVPARAIGRPNWAEKVLPVWLTTMQLGSSTAAIIRDRTPAVPVVATPPVAHAATATPQHQDTDLWSCNAIMRCRIQALDGRSGHVHGLLVNDETWALKFLIVSTNHWWAGHQVLIEPKSVLSVSESTITINLSKKADAESPSYDLKAQLAREKALDVYADYAHLGYWARWKKSARALLDR